MKIIILEDQYTPRIAQELLSIDKDIYIPIQENIKNPFDYLNLIADDTIIALDNYFPGKGWEEPLGNKFLFELMKTGKDYTIICISDRGKRLIEDYEGWKGADGRGWIIGWTQNKSGTDIYDVVKQNLLLSPPKPNPCKSRTKERKV